MASNFTPNLDAIFKEINRRLGNLETGRRAGYTTIDQGDLRVSGGRIVVNPDGANLTLDETPDAFGGTVGALRFYSQDPTLSSKFSALLMADAGYGSITELVSFPSASGSEALLTLAGNGGAQLSAQNADGSQAAMVICAQGSPYSVYPGSSAIFVQPGTVDGTWVLFGNTTRISGIDWTSTGAEWQAGNGSGGFVPVRASSFPISSSRAVKRDLAELPFDALAAVRAARVQQWRYIEEHATEDVVHISPMAEDLPPELVSEHDKVKGVDLLSLVGTLWEAVRQLSDEVNDLKEQVRTGSPTTRSATETASAGIAPTASQTPPSDD